MKVNYIIQSVKKKLNKLDSKDFDNVLDTHILSTYNEVRIDWLRTNLVGYNVQKLGDESSNRRMDDFNIILTLPTPLVVVKKDRYYISEKLFENYMAFKRLELKVKSNCCEGTLHMKAYLNGESNIDLLLDSDDKNPSFDWGETICSLVDGRLKIYTNNEFEIEEANLIYYRFPAPVEKAGVHFLEKGVQSTVDIDCEFKKDLCSLFIAETVASLAGDIESLNQREIQNAKIEKTN